MDPITIIVAALATGAAAGLKPTAEKVVKDAYEGVKALIRSRYRDVSLDTIENDPTSKARQDVVKEDLQKTKAGNDVELLKHAQTLLTLIQAHDSDVAGVVGVSLKDIKVASSLSIEDITSSGTGVSIKGADVGNDMTIKGVRAGGAEASTPNP